MLGSGARGLPLRVHHVGQSVQVLLGILTLDLLRDVSVTIPNSTTSLQHLTAQELRSVKGYCQRSHGDSPSLSATVSSWKFPVLA